MDFSHINFIQSDRFRLLVSIVMSLVIQHHELSSDSLTRSQPGLLKKQTNKNNNNKNKNKNKNTHRGNGIVLR